MTPDTSDRTIVITRLISAPRERVWQAWTDPEQVIHWWGPNGFTNTFHEHDFRIGGVWRFMMHGPDGTDYPNRIIFEEIREPEFISYWHDSDDDNEKDPHRFHAEATFVEAEGGTQVTLRLICQTVEDYQFKVKFGAIEGGKQTLGRLEEFVTSR